MMVLSPGSGRIRLETEHYEIVTADETAVRAWYESWLRNEEIVRYAGLNADLSLQEHLKWAATHDGKWLHLFTVIDKADGRHVGLLRLVCDLVNLRAMPTAVLGDKAHWGQNRAYEALGALYDFAFDSLGLNKIWSLIWAKNERALRAMEKSGRKSHGVLRQHEWAQGVGWLDVHVFGMTKSDWQAMRSSVAGLFPKS
jgi:ribosomal-protein-alanine N-acetyltransferase